MKIVTQEEKEKLATYKRDWDKKNPEKRAAINARRVLTDEQKEKNRIRKRKWDSKPENRERHNALARVAKARRKANNPEIVDAQIRNWSYKGKYGITLEDYDRMFKAQGGVCAICFKNNTVKRLSVDHNHTTGAVRGLLCHRCNTSLGLLNDDVNVLLSAIKYLGQWDTE